VITNQVQLEQSYDDFRKFYNENAVGSQKFEIFSDKFMMEYFIVQRSLQEKLSWKRE